MTPIPRLEANANLLEMGQKLFCNTVADFYPIGCRVRYAPRGKVEYTHEVVRLPDYRDQQPWFMAIKNLETHATHWIDVRFVHPQKLGNNTPTK